MSEQGMPMGGPPMPGGQMQQPTGPMGQLPMPPQGMPPPQMPAPIPQTVHDVKISRLRKYGCAKVENVPPEEFGITRRQRSVMLRDCDYCYHEVKRTEAELIADGYDEEQVQKLPDYAGDSTGEEASRDTVEEGSSEGDAAINKANRLIRVTEHYVVMDYEGKGKARRYRVTTAGESSEILKRKGELSVEPDMVRFAAMTPYIMTHRFFGRSVADLVMDIQKIKTAIQRALLDNMYTANNQRLEVSEQHATKDTLDDILSNRIGGIIRTKMPGGLVPVPNSEIGSFGFPLLQYMDARREERTGVTKQGQGLDPDALQNIGERAVLDQASAARAKTKLIARIFAETGIKEMFWLLHATIRENATEADTVKLKGNWTPVDPQEWRQRDDLTVNVGLGGLGNEQEAAFLMQILQLQDKAIETPTLKLAKPENAYATLKQLIRKGGLKNIEPYFTDPSKEPDVPPKPSPEEQKVQGQLEAEKMKQDGQLKLAAAKSVQDGQLEGQKLQANTALELKKLEQEGQMKLRQIEMEMALKERQVVMEIDLKSRQLVAELDLKRELGLASIKAGANGGGGSTGSVHVGGDAG